MRMATFNILHGRSVHDGAVELDRLVESVRLLDADVLALQEVDLDQPRSSMADLTALAAQAMGAVTHRFVAAISGTPGATWMAATGREQPGTAAYGIALLSRFPVLSWQVLRLPRIPVTFPMYLREPNKVLMVRRGTARGDGRAAGHAAGPDDGRQHAPDVRARLESPPAAPPRPRSARIPRTAGADGRPQHDAADDRAVGGNALARRSRPPSPVATRHRQLDHILTDDPTLRADDCQAPELPISDHRALVVDVSRP